MRTPIRWFTALMFLLPACDTPNPLAADPEAVSPQFGVESSGCYTVTFNLTLVPTGPFSYVGAATGDLVGTVDLQFDSSFKVTGNTAAGSGTTSWTITGGIMPLPLAFTTAFDNRNQLSDRPGSPATLFENIGKHRALSGVEKANLTYKGTFTLDPSPLADHDYRGVICV